MAAGAERMTALSEAIAEGVKAARRRNGLTREALAGLASEAGAPSSFTAAAIGNIETGRRDKSGNRKREVTVDELSLLARALETSAAALLGDDAPALGGEAPAPPECPICDAARGPVEATVRADLQRVGELEGVEPGLAETAYTLAAAVDGREDDDRRQMATLAKELRATLKAIEDCRAARSDGSDDGDELGGLGEPD